MASSSSNTPTVLSDEPKKKRDHLTIEYDQPKITSFFKTQKTDLFSKQYELIKQMRQKGNVAGDAPVDTQGCNYLAINESENMELSEQEREEKLKTFRYQTLLSLLLSSQTKDQITAAAMRRLQEYGCTVDHINETSLDKIASLIKPVTYYPKKAEYISKTTKILKEKYNGDIPNSIEELRKLPGIGNKMAILCMNSAFGKPSGIGVDTHVHRIANRLKWVQTKNPEQTRKALEQKVPKKLWGPINELLVGFGQKICTAGQPKCYMCLLSKEDGLCAYYTEVVKHGGTKRKIEDEQSAVKKRRTVESRDQI